MVTHNPAFPRTVSRAGKCLSAVFNKGSVQIREMCPPTGKEERRSLSSKAFGKFKSRTVIVERPWTLKFFKFLMGLWSSEEPTVTAYHPLLFLKSANANTSRLLIFIFQSPKVARIAPDATGRRISTETFRNRWVLHWCILIQPIDLLPQLDWEEEHSQQIRNEAKVKNDSDWSASKVKPKVKIRRRLV